MSDVDICNSALIKLGIEQISALNENSRAAQLCNEQYDKQRKMLLRAHPWNFAVKREALTATVNTPVYEFSLEYNLPSDYLRIIDTEYPDSFYQIENNKLYSNISDLKVRYISDITDTDLFTPDFAELLSLKIAIDLSYVLVQSPALTERLMMQYESALRDIRSFDGQENPSYPVMDDIFLNVRY
jgi:hypothetical protein